MDGAEEEEDVEMGIPMSERELSVFQRRLDLASAADQNAWESAYRRIMANAIEFFNWKLREGDDLWELVPPSDPRDTVSLYQQATRDGFYILKACGTLRARADRVFHLNKDNCWDTRRTWDSVDLSYVEQVNSYTCEVVDPETEEHTTQTINVVKSTVSVPVPGVWDRWSLGIQWSGYDNEAGTYKLVYKTADHFYETCPKDHVTIDNLTGVWVRPLDPKVRFVHGRRRTTNFCDCVIIAYVNPKGWIPSVVINLFREKLRKRLHLYERVAGKGWKKYYGGKNPARDQTKEARE